MYTALDVASFILQQMKRTTTLKLQKLLYYCQAWNLAWEDAPLFDEDFQAWANGPVIRELYDLHKGMFQISFSDFNRILAKNKLPVRALNKRAQNNVLSVLNFYGDKTPQWLSDCTHSERPWREARRGVPLGLNSEDIITKESMRDFYSNLSTHG